MPFLIVIIHVPLEGRDRRSNRMSLFYSLENGLSQDRSGKGASLLIDSHEIEGFHTCEATIPGSNIKIVVGSNFGYGSKSYLYSKMYVGDKIVPFFKETDIRKSFDRITVTLGGKESLQDSWATLFKKVIYQYNNWATQENDIISYFDVLDTLVNGEKVCSNPSIQYDSRDAELFLAIERLAQIVNIIDDTILQHSVVLSQRLTNSCESVLREISTNADEVKKCYNDKWEKHLTIILQYLHKTITVLDMLLLFNTKN